MKWAFRRTVDPTLMVISDAEAVEHLNLPTFDDAALVGRAIRGATQQAENYLGRGLLTQTWKYAQDGWTNEIRLPMAAPLQSVTSVKYYNESGTLTTVSASVYIVDTLSEPGRMYLAPNQVWPTVQSQRPMAVEVTYVVGWTSADLIPGDILDGIYLLVGDTYEHREHAVIGTITGELPNGVISKFADRVWWTPSCEAA
jgi:uncharacterized phiE125 gp8 family phage protein